MKNDNNAMSFRPMQFLLVRSVSKFETGKVETGKGLAAKLESARISFLDFFHLSAWKCRRSQILIILGLCSSTELASDQTNAFCA